MGVKKTSPKPGAAVRGLREEKDMALRAFAGKV